MHRLPTDGSAARRLDARDWAESLVSGPDYTPPYPGALQDEFAWHLVKYLRDDAHMEAEVQVELPGALFTLDFVVDLPVASSAPVRKGAVRRVAPTGLRRRVGFELGGGRSLRDHNLRLRRDATLLANGAVDTVYRLRGSDLLHHMDDVLYLASQWDADVFSERGRINLKTLASPEARALDVRPEQPSVLVPYALSTDDAVSAPERHLWHVANGEAPHILVRRLDRRFPSVWQPYADRLVEPAKVIPLRKAS